jgi:hypothetical protein
MADYEMREVLAEARAWGFNAYADWFDAADLKNPYVPNPPYLLPQALWERKMASFHIAQELGLTLELAVTPNHVFLDQLAPPLLADTRGDEKMFGQLVCPSRGRDPPPQRRGRSAGGGVKLGRGPGPLRPHSTSNASA